MRRRVDCAAVVALDRTAPSAAIIMMMIIIIVARVGTFKLPCAAQQSATIEIIR